MSLQSYTVQERHLGAEHIIGCSAALLSVLRGGEALGIGQGVHLSQAWHVRLTEAG